MSCHRLSIIYLSTIYYLYFFGPALLSHECTLHISICNFVFHLSMMKVTSCGQTGVPEGGPKQPLALGSLNKPSTRLAWAKETSCRAHSHMVKNRCGMKGAKCALAASNENHPRAKQILRLSGVTKKGGAKEPPMLAGFTQGGREQAIIGKREPKQVFWRAPPCHAQKTGLSEKGVRNKHFKVLYMYL